MEAWVKLAATQTAAGDQLILRRRGAEFEIRCNGWELMSSRAHHSEEAMGHLVASQIAPVRAGLLPLRILIGGLGLGYTVRAVLDMLPETARIVVAEVVPEIVAWNRTWLASLAGNPLADPRVEVACNDVADLLRRPESGFDAILLDVDNGPGSVVLAPNRPLYTRAGLSVAQRALRSSGMLAVWSADRVPAFEHQLTASALLWRAIEVPARGRSGDPVHVIYLARTQEPHQPGA